MPSKCLPSLLCQFQAGESALIHLPGAGEAVAVAAAWAPPRSQLFSTLLQKSPHIIPTSRKPS